MGGDSAMATLGKLIKSGSLKAWYEDKVKDALLGLNANLVLSFLQGDLNSTLIDELNEYTKSNNIAVVILDALDDLVVGSVKGKSYFQVDNTTQLQLISRVGNVASPLEYVQIKAGMGKSNNGESVVLTNSFTLSGQSASIAKTSIQSSDGLWSGTVATVGVWAAGGESFGYDNPRLKSST